MKDKYSNPLKQIHDKKYHQKYINKFENIFLLGIEFEQNDKNISKFELLKI